MRVGQNPAKFVKEVAKPARVTVAVLNYIPFLSGFYAQALDVLKVSLNSLCQNTPEEHDLLVFDNGSCAEVQDYLAFLAGAGLPITLAEIGLAGVSRSDLEKVAATSVEVEDMFNMPYPVTPPMVLDALYQADAWGKKWHEEEDRR